MDWNSLKVFLSIVRRGSLSGAAEDLGVNHTTIFRRLKAFEAEIGGQLFERISNRYELTALGHELLGLAQNIEDSFDSISRHLVGKDFQPKGTVKITAPNNIAYRYLPRYISEFNALYPEIHIELLVSNQEFNMSNRQADIAVRATPSPPEHLVGRQVSTLNWGVFGSKAYANKFGLPNDIGELVNHSLIGATGAMSNLPAFRWLDKHFADQVITRSDDLTAMSYFAESGQGLAVLPEDQLRPEITKLFGIPDSKPSNLWLLTHPDLRNVERIKLVMQHLTKAFSKEWPA
ncbi:DNA-binding transcriptional regulator, LysR family [Pseudidiomarina planktonica]|uniref:DNA-binding transcriptional regulator, LysR family n=1 Tax=Pseudidiomarina planktonica TaxID=1323738 RepID=A0A1Y6EEU1_9GAMM|nr:LysR family transcriptional regulator [Pseudidiomarina planktonica]RUO66345.1 LysR family transcriptional regulator [Pseudidiomarina planktonica]SMQ58683.1 DNA-binding transcriptional regulator, LysR family [Pseudidiomarina planktonica]